KSEIEAVMALTYNDASRDGGKKLRGALTVIISDCLSGDHEKAVKYGAAVEFIHQGSIVHDDILDEHDERRGKPTHVITDGIKRALLMGDMCFIQAIKIGANGGSDEAKAVALALETVLGGAMKEASIGDSIDELIYGKVEDNIYYKIIDSKTAALFGCAAQFGAMSSTPDEKARKDFFDYGMLIGRCYQIADDMTDLYKMASGDTEITPMTVIPIIPALLKYNKNMIKRLPFKMLMGKVDIVSMAMDGISDIDISGKMLADIREKMKEASEITSRYTFADNCYINQYPMFAINKILGEVGEKL
ncbi:MAG: polyprenyl synthetase family protein, partial [Coriobacteriia bacterium]|nr:polyprenyl synthetase family protein [Coriobacteriia bacterium]